MLEAVRDFRDATGRQVGVKPAGGIRTTKDAIKYLVLVNETVGDDWLDPDWFRLGASSLLNDLLHAAAEAGDRPLLRPRLRDCRLRAPMTSMLFEYAPAPESRADRRHQRRPTGCSSAASSSTRRRASLQDRQPGHRGGPRRGRRRPAPTTSTAPSRPHAGHTTGVWGRMSGPDRGKYLFRIARIMQERSRELAVLEIARQRQADQGVARRRRPAGGGALLLLRRLGGQAGVRGLRRRTRGRSASPAR